MVRHRGDFRFRAETTPKKWGSLFSQVRDGTNDDTQKMQVMALVGYITAAVGSAPTAPPTSAQTQPPAWLVYGLPVLSVLLAFVAALFALLAWLRMARQIDLAEKQIAQQDKAIDLATKDFDATLTALGITRQQAELADAERARQPELRLFVNGDYPAVRVVGNHRLHQEDPAKVAFELKASLANTGNKTATAISIEIVLPGNWDDNSSSAGFQRPEAFRFQDGVGTRTLSRPLVPATDVFIGTIFASAHPGTYTFQWMAKTEQGFFAYPPPEIDHAGFEITIESPGPRREL